MPLNPRPAEQISAAPKMIKRNKTGEEFSRRGP